MARRKPSYPAGFYVYQLVDPRTCAPFYVGKGQRDRAWHHERDARAGKKTGNVRKNERIAEIVGDGQSVTVEIIRVFDNELDALDLEYLLIEENPTFTNIAAGWAGQRPEVVERRRQRYLRKRADLLERRFEARREALHKYRGADKHRDEIDSWVDGVKSSAIEPVLSLPPPNRIKPIPKPDAEKRCRKRPSKRVRPKSKGHLIDPSRLPSVPF